MLADEFAVFPRGATAVKGKGFMKTFFVWKTDLEMDMLADAEELPLLQGLRRVRPPRPEIFSCFFIALQPRVEWYNNL